MMEGSECQDNYPIKRSEEHRVNRRQFAAFCGCSALALGAGVPIRKALLGPPESSESMVVADVDELRRGDSKLFSYPTKDYPCILIRLKDGSFVAYSQSCTHLMCPVHFDAIDEQLVCPCHNGFFDPKDGSVVSGPPQRGLPSYEVTVVDRDVIVGPKQGPASPTDSKSV